jgi:glutamine amidotransferase
MVKTVIIDYGMGNLRNVQKAFEHIGIAAEISSQGQDLLEADGLVLPGVGAFGDAMDNLSDAGLIEPIQRSVANGKPLIGICLGLQLLFQSSNEMGEHQGLGLLPGRVVRFGNELKVPHIGWNQLDFAAQAASSPLLKGLANHGYAYFVHSYHAVPANKGCILTTSSYGIDFVSMVQQENVFGAQFHPEKSQEVGLGILCNFAEIVKGHAR